MDKKLQLRVDLLELAEECSELICNKRSILLVEQLFLAKTKKHWENKFDTSKTLLEWFWEYHNKRVWRDKLTK